MCLRLDFGIGLGESNRPNRDRIDAPKPTESRHKQHSKSARQIATQAALQIGTTDAQDLTERLERLHEYLKEELAEG